MGQPGLVYFEPAFADEVALIMRWAFDHVQRPGGSSVYLRLSTRVMPQQMRADDRWEDGALKGGYWLKHPAPGAEAAIIAAGPVMPEALAAWAALQDDTPGIGLMAVTSPDLLHRGWSDARAARWRGTSNEPAHIARLLAALSPHRRPYHRH
jgi:pyruvate dehydrogenase E1 component